MKADPLQHGSRASIMKAVFNVACSSVKKRFIFAKHLSQFF